MCTCSFTGVGTQGLSPAQAKAAKYGKELKHFTSCSSVYSYKEHTIIQLLRNNIPSDLRKKLVPMLSEKK